MDKKKLIMIAISTILLIAICATIGLSGVLSPYQRQIRLGYKLLEQGSYEEAILAFDKAIEIDVKRAKAYIGKADVYVTRCDENTLEDTKKVLETGYAHHYDDEAFVDAIIRLADELIKNNKKDYAIKLLNFGYELTKDEVVKNYYIKLLNESAKEVLAELYQMFENNDRTAIESDIRSEKYNLIAQMTTEGDKCIYFAEDNDSRSGKGLAVYYVAKETFNPIFVYYGDFVDGQRSGTGLWFGVGDNKVYTYEGDWDNDYPNGDGKIHTEYNTMTDSGLIRSEITCQFKKGVFDGNYLSRQYFDDNEVHIFETNAIDGILQPTGTNGKGEPIVEGRWENANISGLYLNLTNTQKRCIVGFDE